MQKDIVSKLSYSIGVLYARARTSLKNIAGCLEQSCADAEKLPAEVQDDAPSTRKSEQVEKQRASTGKIKSSKPAQKKE